MRPSLSPLDFALLALLARGPASGYDLRRVFQVTPLGRYSDSPGSIYPALRRLEAKRLIVGRDDRDPRRRRTLRLTNLGRRALLDWINQPVRTEDLARDPSIVDLRLAFVSDVLPERLPAFLREYAHAAAQYATMIDGALSDSKNDMSQSAGLALDLGVVLARARARWCHAASQSIDRS